MLTNCRSSERGIASVLILFALCAFSVLGVSAVTTSLADVPPGTTYDIFRHVVRAAETEYFARMWLPTAWRSPGSSGSTEFQFHVPVPDDASVDKGSAPAAWTASTEFASGMAVCC